MGEGRPAGAAPGPIGVTPKSHDQRTAHDAQPLDALCVGVLDREARNEIVRVRTTPDRSGFLRLRRARGKQHFGFISGDLAQATVPYGKWAGTWVGHIAVRARGQHSLATPAGRINVSHRNLRLLQRGDGYSYARHDVIVQDPCEKSA